MITHIDYKFDDKKLLEEAEKLEFQRICVKATDYTPAEDGYVYLPTGSTVILDDDVSYFEKTAWLEEGYHYDVSKELCDFMGIKKWRLKLLRYSPGDAIFTHKDNPKISPVAINHLFGGSAPIIFNQTEVVNYKTAIIDISGVFHRVVNTSDSVRYTLKIIPLEITYEELSEIATRLKISI